MTYGRLLDDAGTTGGRLEDDAGMRAKHRIFLEISGRAAYRSGQSNWDTRTNEARHG